MGSLLLPSLCVGFIWALYLAIRLCVDIGRLIWTCKPDLRVAVAIHAAFLLAATGVIVYGETKADTLEYQIASLRYHHGPEACSKIMPAIVSRGSDAVEPLILAATTALNNEDLYARKNMLIGITFCLGRIGGDKAESFLAQLVKQHMDSTDWYDRRWQRSACFAYARCAGPRAMNDLVALFEKTPHTEDRDERWVPLVALAMTGSKSGVSFALDHMSILFDGMEGGGNSDEMSIVQAAAERLVFGSDPQALAEIPVYREVTLMGATWLANPRPNDYTSEFYWTDASQSKIRVTSEILSTWKDRSAAIRKRWDERLK